jgi:glycosyltransferase involved in cell wall biosynthesis
MEAIKDQETLVNAFLRLTETDALARDRLRLVIVGDGRLRQDIIGRLRDSQRSHVAWVPGNLDNIPDVMRGLDLFVLPSRREGTSNTILEAMASGLPVIATSVGGNPELVIEGDTGLLVPPAAPEYLAEAIRSYMLNPGLLRRHGMAGRERVERRFSIGAMVNGYLSVYDNVVKDRGCAA